MDERVLAAVPKDRSARERAIHWDAGQMLASAVEVREILRELERVGLVAYRGGGWWRRA